MKNEKKTTLIFVFQKYSQFWSVLLGQKPLISEDRLNLLTVLNIFYEKFQKSNCGEHSKYSWLFYTKVFLFIYSQILHDIYSFFCTFRQIDQ